MPDKEDSKLQQISASVAALAVAIPPLLQGDNVAAAIGLSGVGLVSLVENLRARTKKLDDMVREALTDEKLAERFDATVKTDEFFGLYLRARDMAAKSEKEDKLRYIRNFLIHAITTPTSAEPDKERYLRLIDELTFREHEYLISFLRMVAPSAGAANLETWIDKPTKTGGMISTFACHLLGEPQGSSSHAVNNLTNELVVSFRHMHSVGLLNGVSVAGGDMFQFDTNGFTPKFLRFVIDPF